jgi:tRNA C32,U32 (ribose-2'-O)-methylase TrmJ
MPRWVYPGFDRLNRRRGELIQKKLGAGVTELEARELDMLQEIVDKIAWFNHHLPDPLWRLKESSHAGARAIEKKIDQEISEDMLKRANDKIYKLMQTLRWVYAKADLTYKEKVAVRMILGDSKWDKYL